MKRIILSLVLVVGSVAQAEGEIPAISAAPFFTTIAPFFTTGATFGMPLSKRIIENAKEDAANFVGSNGQVRGAQLQQALNYIRQANPAAQASDMDLANLILTEQP